MKAPPSPPVTTLVPVQRALALPRQGPLAVYKELPQVYTADVLAKMTPEELQAVVLRLQQHNLGIIRQAEHGGIRCVRVRMAFRVGQELTQFSQWDRDANNGSGGYVACPPFINAQGWNRANTVAGVQLKLAPDVLVEGKTCPNPYYISNPKTGAIERVFCRMIGVGRSETGNRIGRDHTVIYLPGAYFIEDVHGKEHKAKEAITGFAQRPGEPIPAGMFYLPEFFDPSGEASIGTLIDPKHEIVRWMLKVYTQRVKKALSIAQTMCARDILKKMLALPNPVTNQQGVGYVQVTGWIEDDAEWRRINESLDSADALAEQGVEMETGVNEVTAAEASADGADDVSELDPEPDDPAATPEVRAATSAPPPAPAAPAAPPPAPEPAPAPPQPAPAPAAPSAPAVTTTAPSPAAQAPRAAETPAAARGESWMPDRAEEEEARRLVEETIEAFDILGADRFNGLVLEVLGRHGLAQYGVPAFRTASLPVVRECHAALTNAARAALAGGEDEPEVAAPAAPAPPQPAPAPAPAPAVDSRGQAGLPLGAPAAPAARLQGADAELAAIAGNPGPFGRPAAPAPAGSRADAAAETIADIERRTAGWPPEDFAIACADVQIRNPNDWKNSGSRALNRLQAKVRQMQGET